MRSARAAIRLGRDRARRARRRPSTRAGRARRRVRLPEISSEPRPARAARGVRARVSASQRVRGTRRRPRSRHAPAPVRPSARARWPALRRARTPPAHGATRGDPGRSADRLRPPARGEPRAARSARPPRTPPSEQADAGTRPSPSRVSKPSDSTAFAAVSGIPSCWAARHRSARSPTGSAAARSSNRRAPRGSRASRRVKLRSIPVDRGSAAGRPKPPASWPGVSPRGSSRSASGFPPVSATICSSTDSSSRAARTDSKSARASRRPSGSTRSCGKRAKPLPTSRVAKASAILSASSR